VVRRIWARSDDDDPGSTQARMMSSPVLVLVTAQREGPSVTRALRPPQVVDHLAQPLGRFKSEFGVQQCLVAYVLPHSF